MMPIPRFKIDLSVGDMLHCFRSLLSGGDGNSQANFERETARKAGRRHAVTFSSGRMALYAALSALNVPADRREILVPAFTVPEVITMIRCAGWRVVFADAHISRYNVEPDEAESRLTPNTSAVLMTHLFGQTSDADAFEELAARKQLLLLEDAAQALGAEYKGQPAGSFGLAGLFSFGLVKNLTTLGGGMVVTDDEALAAELRKIKNGWKKPDRLLLTRKLSMAAAVKFATGGPAFSLATYPALTALDFTGSDFADRLFDEDPAELALTEVPAYLRTDLSQVQATWGLMQLPGIDERNTRRRNNALLLHERLEGVKGLGLPEFDGRCKGNHLNFAVRHANPAQFIKRLRRLGIDTSTGYLSNCADSPLFPDFKSDCPVAAMLERELFYLPTYPTLERRDIERIADATRKVADELA